MAPSIRSLGAIAVLCLGLLSPLISQPVVAARLSPSDRKKQVEQMKEYAIEHGIVSITASDADYSCSASKRCKLGCCGSV